MLKAILFDIDNTLLSFDEYVKESMRCGFEEFGIGPYRDEMFGVFLRENSALWHALERGEIDFNELKKQRWNRIFACLGISADGEAFETYFRGQLFDSAIPVEGAMELLQALHGKYLLCAASNGPYLQQVNRLKVGGMLPYFTELFISEEIGSSKPSRRFFEVCAERLKVRTGEEILPCEMMIIGDSLTSDMAGGVGFGMQTCFYHPSGTAVPDGMDLTYCVTSLREILDFL